MLALQEKGDSSQKREQEIQVFIGDPIEFAIKTQKLDDFVSALYLTHTIGDNTIVDYSLPKIGGPGNTEWEFAVTSISGKTYPEFMTLNPSCATLKFRPDKDEYSDNTFYWLLSVKEKDSDTYVRDGLQMQVTVLPPVDLTYEVVITDGALGLGQIIFSHAVNMAWLLENFDSFFSAFLVNNETSQVTSVNSLEASSFDRNNAGTIIDFQVPTFDVKASTLSLGIVMGINDFG